LLVPHWCQEPLQAGLLTGGPNQHRAEDWKELLLPEIEGQQKLGRDVVFRADAAFAKSEINEAVEGHRLKYAIRIHPTTASSATSRR
jgi:hypothetical protein